MRWRAAPAQHRVSLRSSMGLASAPPIARDKPYFSGFRASPCRPAASITPIAVSTPTFESTTIAGMFRLSASAAARGQLSAKVSDQNHSARSPATPPENPRGWIAAHRFPRRRPPRK